jgi:uncharacterized protein (TIGR03067 family)
LTGRWEWRPVSGGATRMAGVESLTFDLADCELVRQGDSERIWVNPDRVAPRSWAFSSKSRAASMNPIKCQVVVLVAALVVAAVAAADDATSTDLQALEGAWDIVSIEADGMKVDAGKGAPEKAVIKDGKATFFSQGKPIPTFKDLKLRIDATKKPRAVDLLRGDEESLPCIYEVTADELKLAMPLVPKERKPGEALQRPESFDTKDKPVTVLLAKRSKS